MIGFWNPSISDPEAHLDVRECESLRSVMAEHSGEVGGGGAAEPSGNGASPAPLSVSGSFKEGKSSSRRRGSVRPSLDADEFLNLLHGSDPVKVELNRLENEVRGANAVPIRSFCVEIWSMICLIT